MTARPPKAGAMLTASRSSRRRWVLAIVLVGAATLAWFWQPLGGFAVTGASYGARVACSCRFVGGRSLGDCRKDFESGMELVVLSEDAKAKSVTATFPLLSRQTARYYEGEGCRLDPWKR